jgi:proline dehydrogenase
MLRNALLYLSSQPRVFKFVRRNSMAKSFANRFVAGETLETALAAVKQLNSKGITATLDLLGESVHSEGEARDGARQYIQMLDEIQRQKLNANASVKLTAMVISREHFMSPSARLFGRRGSMRGVL